MTDPKFNNAGRSIIEEFEGCVLTPYQDSVGVFTQGYGHTLGITANSAPWTQQQAELVLSQDIYIFEFLVKNWVEVDLNDNQFSALVCLCFNEGSAPLHKTLGSKLSDGDYAGAAREFNKWVYAGGQKLDGLVRRRAAERRLFETPV